MRPYVGTDKRDPDAITRIDYFLRDVDAAMARLTKSQAPTGAGTVIGGGGPAPDLTQYAYLPGRSGGQTLLGAPTAVVGSNLVLKACTGGPELDLNYNNFASLVKA
jgi:hypothetical protein